MNAIEQIDQETYQHIGQYHADIDSIPYRRNEEYRNAIERKMARSWAKLRGTPGTQTAPGQKNLSVQTFANGQVAVGSAAEISAIRNANHAENERTKQRAPSGSVSNIRNLRVKIND